MIEIAGENKTTEEEKAVKPSAQDEEIVSMDVAEQSFGDHDPEITSEKQESIADTATVSTETES